MKVNHGKCHLLLNRTVETNIQVSGTTAKSSKYQEANRVHFDNKWKFIAHTENICKKFNKKTKCFGNSYTFYGS